MKSIHATASPPTRARPSSSPQPRRVPLCATKRSDVVLDSKALRQRKVVGGVLIEEPEINLVDASREVQLSGFVVSDDQKSSAETIAKAVPSVVEVGNAISLKH